VGRDGQERSVDERASGPVRREYVENRAHCSGDLVSLVRDAGILGMEGAVKYVRDHWAMLVNGQGFELSDKRIIEFLMATLVGEMKNE
jgi:hypothetical protein